MVLAQALAAAGKRNSGARHQAQLARRTANAFAIAGKAIGAFARAVLVGETDVHQTDRFFRRAAAGSGDAGDADAESRAGAFTDAIGEGESDFGADRAFRFDNALRNADEAWFSVRCCSKLRRQENRRSCRARW